MAKSKKPAMQSCSCCTVRFRSGLCPQCYVAGCAHKAKGSACLQDGGSRGSRKMTEFEVREAYAKLLAEHQQLLQSLESKTKTNGHAELPPQTPSQVKLTTRIVEGELQHG